MTTSTQHAERTVLGAVLASPVEFDVLACELRPEDFAHHGHRAMWSKMAEVREEGAEPSPALLMDRLERSGEIGALGGVEGIAGMVPAYVDKRDLRDCVRLVRDNGQLRRVVAVCQDIAKRAGGELDSVGQFVDEAQERVTEACLGYEERPYRTAKDVTLATVKEIGDRMAGRTPAGLPTGIRSLDELLGGMRPGQQIVIAARPSVGKTMFAGQLVLNAARSGVPCIVFSAEMGANECTERLIANAGSVHLAVITGKRQAAEYEGRQLIKGAEEVAELPIVWEDAGSQTPASIRSRVRRWKVDRKHGAYQKRGLVVVDYLQILDLDDVRGREQAVAKASRALKVMARETGSVVLLLSQLNRALESRADPRPLLSDLRESGAIEQDADVVLGLHRDRDKETNRMQDAGLVRVLKNRGGQVGDVPLKFTGKFQRVEVANW